MRAYVGCYTSETRGAIGDGVNVYAIGEDGGAWRHLGRVGGLINPSFLILNRAADRLYVAHGQQTYVSAYALNSATGALTRLNAAEVRGRNPNHLALDPAERFLLTSNYDDGTVAVLPIDVGGAVGRVRHLARLPGEPGPHRTQQARSHPHHIQFDPSGRFVAVADKGLDRIFVFAFDPGSGAMTPAATPFVATRAAAGPRRLVFHPGLPAAYGLNELDFTVTTFDWDGEGKLTPVETQTTIPITHTARNSAGEIVVSPTGAHLYISNRGHDSIATFAIGRDGRIRPADWRSAQGRRPRFMALHPDGRHLYVANQDSHAIVHFRLGEDGLPQAPGEAIENKSPTCIGFA